MGTDSNSSYIYGICDNVHLILHPILLKMTLTSTNCIQNEKKCVKSMYSKPIYRNLKFIYFTLPQQSSEPKLTLFYDFLSSGGGGGGGLSHTPENNVKII